MWLILNGDLPITFYMAKIDGYACRFFLCNNGSIKWIYHFIVDCESVHFFYNTFKIVHWSCDNDIVNQNFTWVHIILRDIIKVIDGNITSYNSFTFDGYRIDFFCSMLVLCLWFKQCILKFDDHYSKAHVLNSRWITTTQISMATWCAYITTK